VTALPLPRSPADRLPAVVVYRDDLLRPSERFVVDPLAHLRRFRPVLAGTRRFPGAPDVTVPTVALTDGPGLPERLRVAAFRGLGLDGRLLARLRRFEPRVVHAHFGLDAVQALPLARRLGVPLGTTFHGYDVVTRPELLAAQSYRGRRYVHQRHVLAATGAAFLAVSDFLRERLCAQGFPRERLRTHYVGIDTTYFTPSGHPRSGLLFVGRLVACKGVAHLLDAFTAVAAHHPDVVHTGIGEGPERAHLERVAASRRLPVRFLGSQPREVVRHHLDRTALLCSPSHEQPDGTGEALGLVNVEAQAMQVPVVGYATGGIPEAVAHAQTGLLVPPGDVRTLASAIRHVLTEPRLGERMGSAGRARVLAEFDLVRQTARLEDVYGGVTA